MNVPARPGSDLWAQVDRVSDRALASGAQLPVTTAREVLAADGVRWLVHVVERIEHKQRLTSAQRVHGVNPFLPHDPDLFVAEIAPAHLVLLNKFNVIHRHLLIVTRRFEAQEALLSVADFEALWRCMVAGDGLGFYNGGVEAGASQAHKHLQLVPLPLGQGPESYPMEPLLRSAGPDGTVAGLPFAHMLRRTGSERHRSVEEAAVLLHDHYREMLGRLGIEVHGKPYNLLLTRQWMLVVPRRQETFRGISVNGLGFAGSLLVRSRDELETVREVGPMRVLAEVAEARC